MSHDLTVCVCTYNSARTLGRCLQSIRHATDAPVVVVDHMSTDCTPEIARRFGCRFYTEGVGLGYARGLCFRMTDTDYLAFVDSDVEITDPRFFDTALSTLSDPSVGAVVGVARGHVFCYGLPASLLVLRKNEYKLVRIPHGIDARETFYIMKVLRERRLGVRYVRDAMVHRSGYRRYKPEWEGANTRLLDSSPVLELPYCFLTVVMVGLNSRSVKNIAYTPVFYLKFLRGFIEPAKWRRLSRKADEEGAHV